MKDIIVKLCEISTTVLPIGFEGENNSRRIVFDASDLFAEYPAATASLTVKPPVGDVYPKATTKDGNLVIWEISASDCANDGDRQYQLTFTQGEAVRKTWEGYTKVYNSLTGSGSAPTPVEDWIDDAQAALNALEALSASASSLPYGSPATAEMTEVDGHKNIAIGVPAGQPGEDGYSPAISITDIPGGHRVTVTDKTGTRSFDVLNGTNGDPGTPGKDGVSPTVTVTNIPGGHQVTITDATGAHTFAVMDGQDVDPKDYVKKTDFFATEMPMSTEDETTVSEKFGSLLNEINDKYEKPSTGIPASDLASGVIPDVSGFYTKPVSGIPASDLASGVIPSVPVQDVQVAGASVLSQGVANIPYATGDDAGVVILGAGLSKDSGSNKTYINFGTSVTIKNGDSANRPVPISKQHESIFYGLSKLAGVDLASGSDTVGVYPDAAKVAIQKMLGIYEAPWELIREDTFTNATAAAHEITVDGNGQAFELTDAVVMVELPSQSVESKITGYIQCYDGATKTAQGMYMNLTQAANASTTNGTFMIVEKRNGLVFVSQKQIGGSTSSVAMYMVYREGFAGSQSIFEDTNFKINKVIIPSTTGTGHYKLYGKRKWN